MQPWQLWQGIFQHGLHQHGHQGIQAHEPGVVGVDTVVVELPGCVTPGPPASVVDGINVVVVGITVVFVVGINDVVVVVIIEVVVVGGSQIVVFAGWITSYSRTDTLRPVTGFEEKLKFE